MQNELQYYIDNLVQKYNNFYENLDNSEKIPLLNYIEKNLNKKYNIRTAWKKNSSLYIVNYDIHRSDLNETICRQANGVIFDKSTNKIVCFIYNAILEASVNELYNLYHNIDFSSQQYYKQFNEFRAEIQVHNNFIDTDTLTRVMDVNTNFDNYSVQKLYDGTLIKLFYYNNKWCVATNKCIDADQSKWTSNRSYWELFTDIPLNYEILNKDHCYAFMLLHPENRLICEYKRPILVNIGEFDLLTGEEVINTVFSETEQFTNNQTDQNIFIPETMNFSSMSELLLSFDNSDLFPGYFLINKQTRTRVKIINPKYKYLQYIKGNSRNMLYKMVTLQKYDRERKLLLEYFPEYNELDMTIKNILKKIVYYIYTQWYNSYVNNITPYVYPEFLHPIANINKYIKQNNIRKDDVTIQLFSRIILNQLNGKKLINLYTTLTNNIYHKTMVV